MATNIGAKIELAGEREFRRALSEINTGLRTTASELTLVTAKYADNANSVTALTAKNEVLQTKIAQQTEKVNTLRSALENAKVQYGETDIRTLKWQQSLNLAESELIQVEKELKNNSEALKQATENMERYGLKEDEVAEQSKGLGSVLNDIISSLGINLPSGADKAIKALDDTKASTIALIGVTTGIITAFGKATTETAKMADELLTLSSVTGLSTDTLQELQYASEFVDVSVETMTTSMTRMIRSMDDARKGNKETSDSFRKLRLSVTDNNGQLKDSETMFYQVIDALGKVRNETERDALAMQIFGRSARELNPLIEAGSKRLKELGEEAQKMGYVMSKDSLESFGRLDDAMQKLSKQTDTFKNSLAVVLLPVLTAFFEMLNKIDPKVLATIAVLASVVVVVVSVAKAIKSVTDTFKAFDVATLKTTAIVVGVVAALIALVTIIGVLVGKGKEMEQTMAGIGQSVGEMTNIVNTAPNRLQHVGRNALGTSNWRGGLTWVGEDGPELIDLPAGSKVYNNRQSMQIVRQVPNESGGGDIIIQNMTVQAKDIDEMAKIVRLFSNIKQTQRAGVV